MPWVGQPVSVTSGVDWLVELLRIAIADQKTKIVQIVDETYDSQLSAGTDTETFYTEHLPIASGCDTRLYIDRWLYTEADDIADASGERKYLFNVPSGAYCIPSGAIPGISGGAVKSTYSWEEAQTYKFTDNGLRLFVQDSVVEINNAHYDFGHVVEGIGSSFEIEPMPGIADVASYVYVKHATYLIRKQLEAEGLENRIFVRDLNVTIDTTKGMGELTKSSQRLMDEVADIVETLRVMGQESAFGRIDTYATYVEYDGSPYMDGDYRSAQSNDSSYFGGN